MKSRLRELDFLRGIAIILVIFRHQDLFIYPKNMGWIGVDLFFVLSGFLVSGLMFKEYLNFNDVQPGRFLIRRGFKIYPIYYLFYILYLIPILMSGTLDIHGLLSDLFFVQNYTRGWGYAYVASWSLAVEEHFYILFAVCFWSGLRYNLFKLKPGENDNPWQFEWILISLMVLCIVSRFVSNYLFPNGVTRNFAMSHLRMDSLLVGVLISYLFHFKRKFLERIFFQNKLLLLLVALLCISWTPFISPVPSFFVKTIGFSLLTLTFGIILTYFVLSPDINETLDKIFKQPVVNFISQVGFCSYSIYIIHTFFFRHKFLALMGISNKYADFIFACIFSIAAGFFMTHLVEKFFLKIRDRLYPSRIKSLL